MRKITSLFVTLFILVFSTYGQTRCVVNINFEENNSNPTSYNFSTDFEGDALKYFWHFGDKTTSEEPSPAHVFKYSGNYVITLRIIGSERDVCYARTSGYFKGAEELPAPPQLLHARGVVKDFSSIDGCGLMIVTGREEIFYPAEMVQNFVLAEGQQVIFTYEVITPGASICMAGTAIRIHRIVELPAPPTLQRSVGKVVDRSRISGCGLLIETDNGLLVPAEIIPDFRLVSGQQIHFVYEVLRGERATCTEGPLIKIYKIMEMPVKPVICRVVPIARPIDIRNKTYQFFVRSNEEIVAWSWEFGDGSSSTEAEPVHQYQLPGIYTVTCHIITSNGCESSQEIEVPVREFHLSICPGTMSLKLLDPTENKCDGEATVSLFDENGSEFENVTYLWSTGETGSNVGNLCPNRLYRVKALVPGVCYQSSTFTMLSRPQWRLLVTGGVYTFEVINPLDGVTYLWEISNGDKLYGPVITYNFGAEGRYRVRLTVISESDAAYTEEEYRIEKSATGIEETEMNKFSIYPNPANKTLFINRADATFTPLQLEITDVQGRSLIQKVIPAGESFPVQVNVHQLSPGIYFMRMTSEGEDNKTLRFTITSH